MKKLILLTFFTISYSVAVSAMEYDSNTVFFNGCFGVGTFSAGEDYDGSAFFGGSLSADWVPNWKIGLSYGFESGLLGGKKQDTIIYGIPIIFRIGWYPPFFDFSKLDIFIFGKVGWAFGIWGQNANDNSTSNGIVCGFNIGGRYKLTQSIGIYTEIGYNYYGLARNSNHPEYPFGYGSGKTYISMGISYKIL